MELSYPFTFPIKVGLHARPAGMLQDFAGLYASRFTFENARSGRRADLNSVVALISTDTKQGDPCAIRIVGGDADAALHALKKLIDDKFVAFDEAHADEANAPASGAARILNILQECGAIYSRGLAASKGIAIAKACLVAPALKAIGSEAAGDPADEIARFNDAVARVEDDFQRRRAALGPGPEREIIEAHISIVGDPEYCGRIVSLVTDERLSAAAAVARATEYFSKILSESENDYLKDRVLDLQDISRRLTSEIRGDADSQARIELREPSIVVAGDLAPSAFISLDKKYLKGLVLERGGATSHTVILARASGIPCVAGAGGVAGIVADGDRLILDAQRGLVIRNPGGEIEKYYRREEARRRARAEKLKEGASRAATTKCGKRIEIGVNVSTLADVTSAFENGAEGVGLFRTEMLFMDRETPPTEEEQFDIYARTAAAAGGRSAIIRTLDVGGDKPISYLNLPAEANPFLGYRGARIYGEFENILRTQLRAILRASAHGNLKVMFPMISCVEEVRRLKSLVTEIQADMTKSGIQHNAALEVGIMVEVPAAALIVEELCREVDFVSVGTNDLAQYFLAVDRTNEKVADLLSYLHPSFLRLLKAIVASAHGEGKRVGLCGEMGSNERYLPLLVGLGFDELSSSPPNIPMLKSEMARFTAKDCETLVASAAAQATIADVEALLAAFASRRASAGIVVPELIELDSRAATKEEAIEELVCLLEDAGRIAGGDEVIEAVWRREEVYSTAVGFGVAVPHCMAKSVRENSIAVLRLKDAIDWQSSDGDPVRIVFLIAVCADRYEKDHQRIISSLSRKLMHEGFRDVLYRAHDRAEVISSVKSCF